MIDVVRFPRWLTSAPLVGLLRVFIWLLVSCSTIAQEISDDYCEGLASKYCYTYVDEQKDIEQISKCAVINCDVHITSWDDTVIANSTHPEYTVIDLGNISSINGDLNLILDNGNVNFTKIIANELKEIKGDFRISGLKKLERIRVPKLQQVGSQEADSVLNFTLQDLPNLQSIDIAPGGIELLSNSTYWRRPQLSIINTGIQKIDFLNSIGSGDASGRPSYENFTVTGNPALTRIDLPRWLSGMELMLIRENHPNLTVAFNNLQHVWEMEINHAQSILLPRLTNATHLNIINNTMESLNMSKLQRVIGNITISQNSRLSELAMESLTSLGYFEGRLSPAMGALRVENNPFLLNLSGFPNVANVAYTILLKGNFTNVPSEIANTMVNRNPYYNPSTLHVTSYNTAFNCSTLNQHVADIWYESNFPSEDVYSCKTIDSEGVDISPAPPPVPKRPMSAAIKGAIGGSIGGAAVIALLAWLYRRAWKKNGSQRATRQAQQPRQRRQESLNGDVTEHELDQIARMNGATGGVTREVGDEEDEDRPPKYARVGKPGEVPPVYVREVGSTSSIGQASNTQSTEVRRPSAVSDTTTAVPTSASGEHLNAAR